MKTYLVVRPSPRNSDREEHLPRVYFGDVFDTLEEAKQVAARRAGISGDAHYVTELVGTQEPIYDPDIGWVPNALYKGR